MKLRILKVSMNHNRVLISALFYLLAFVFLDQLFWLMLPALFFLISALVHGSSWRQGFIWGVVVYGGHLGILYYALAMIRPSWWLIALWGCTTLYLTAHVVVLFFVCAQLHEKLRSKTARLCCVLALVCFCFWWIDRKALWVFDAEGGYCLANPLLPLVHGWCQMSDCESKEHAPAWIDQLGIVRLPSRPGQDVDPVESVREFFGKVAHARSVKPKMVCCITPESSLPFPLNKHKKVMDVISDNCSGLALFIGSFYDDGLFVHNGHYWFVEGKLQKFIGKQHVMPLVEKMPRWCNWQKLRLLFLGNGKECCVDGQRREALELLPGRYFYPIICSELFCTNMLKNVPRGAVALVLVNDAWFGATILPQLLWLYALMQAWWYRVPMLYVSQVSTQYKTRTLRVK